MDESDVQRQLRAIWAEIADLRKRVEEAESKPLEILNEIERIWTEDAETGNITLQATAESSQRIRQ